MEPRRKGRGFSLFSQENSHTKEKKRAGDARAPDALMRALVEHELLAAELGGCHG